MQHIEFIHSGHFEMYYHRIRPPRALSPYIDFYWETKFDALFGLYQDGFSDALFPNLGYTYLVNLGTPFVMQLGDQQFEMRTDGFLPRHTHMICHHSKGNKIFGIKFKVSPVLFEKKVNFSEYRQYIFPLAYLVDRHLVALIKSAGDFQERVQLANHYYSGIISRYEGSLKHIGIVTALLNDFTKSSGYMMSVETAAEKHSVSTRTLQRYFEMATSVTAKHAFQIIRIRKAIESLMANPVNFKYQQFGYYDYSHFVKHLRQFLSHSSIDIAKPHLLLLKTWKTE